MAAVVPGSILMMLLVSVYMGISIIYPLIAGLILLSVYAIHRGFSAALVLRMIVSGAKRAGTVIEILLLIGILTAVWRACGTIPYIICHSLPLMDSGYFALSAFLLSCLVSFLLGSSFGTVGTIGIIIMITAAGCGISANLAAGAVMSGAYFGDRCSPMSSSANLVASLTETKLYSNIRNMMKSGAVPFLLSAVLYASFSAFSPALSTDASFASGLGNSFRMNGIVLIPAVLLFVLAFFRINVKLSMSVSVAAAACIGCVMQDVSPVSMVKYMFTGYTAAPGSSDLMNGGGLVSIITTILIVSISSMYADLFEKTGLLSEFEKFAETTAGKYGAFPACLAVSLITAAAACNQILSTILTWQFVRGNYGTEEKGRSQAALDLEDTVILVSVLIPWNIAGAFPTAILAVSPVCLFYSFYIWLVPACRLLEKSFRHL